MGSYNTVTPLVFVKFNICPSAGSEVEGSDSEPEDVEQEDLAPGNCTSYLSFH
jgi:hypothetical protein